MLNRDSIEHQLQLAIEILKRGGVIAFPTDTVYGLGADPYNEQAVERIFTIKNRPKNLRLPLLLADVSDLTNVASKVPEIAWQLAEHFLPGGLTLVLQKSPWIPNTLTAGSDTIAVRIPNNPIAIALIRGLGKPLIGTSANISGMPSAITADEVRDQLGEEIDSIVDGGRCPGTIESTVIDVSGDIPTIIREGAISLEEIVSICSSFPAALDSKIAETG
ncbi:MAG: L-threonylcarbamoyladenylate synthase [Chloroflexota bacterium]|nr:L-threonylcarbamoyladenylate synthase [Chloroflexota bacterium]